MVLASLRLYHGGANLPVLMYGYYPLFTLRLLLPITHAVFGGSFPPNNSIVYVGFIVYIHQGSCEDVAIGKVVSTMFTQGNRAPPTII